VTVDLQETARLLLGLVPKRQFETQDADGRRHQLMEAVLAADLARGVVSPRPVLLWLRAVADDRTPAQAKAEQKWLADAVSTRFQRTLNDYDTVFHNRSAFWPANGAGGRGSCIDSLLAERMMERAAP
jgi:adenine-specific DNA-methyltransferase